MEDIIIGMEDNIGHNMAKVTIPQLIPDLTLLEYKTNFCDAIDIGQKRKVHNLTSLTLKSRPRSPISDIPQHKPMEHKYRSIAFSFSLNILNEV